MRRGALVLLAVAFAGPAAADAEAEIRDRLVGWAAAFNRGDAAAACDLFAEDVVAVVRGAPDGDKAAVCGRLERTLAATDRRLAYRPAVDEVLVWGDHAVVRVTWTLTVTRGDTKAASRERGLDVFRRDPDGEWRIMRFVAFDAEP